MVEGERVKMEKRSFVSVAGRFSIEVSLYDDGNLYRAKGPYGMVGRWHDDEGGCNDDLLCMMQGIKLSEVENDAAISIYEYVHDL